MNRSIRNRTEKPDAVLSALQPPVSDRQLPALVVKSRACNPIPDRAGPFSRRQKARSLDSWKRKPAPDAAPVREGMVVAMQAHALGLWWLNACRIVYLVNEYTPVRRVGFAYGTLPAHVEQGEECFTVELHPDRSVWYDVRAFSRPRYWPVRWAKPLARRLQRRFVRDSQTCMREAVARQSARIPS